MLIQLPNGTSPKPAKEPPWWRGKALRFVAGGVSVAAAFGSVFLPMIPAWVTVIGVAVGLLIITVPFAVEGLRHFWTADIHISPAERHAVAIGLVASTAICVAAAAGVSTYLVVRPEKPDYQAQLLEFFKNGTELYNLPKAEVEKIGVEQYQLRYYNWAFNARHWIHYHMSEAAAERFMQARRGLTLGGSDDVSPEHTRIRNRILDFRENLLELTQDAQWQ